jgi:hypothetical protein
MSRRSAAMAKPKVHLTRIGFHDAIVAARAHEKAGG